MVKQLLPAIAVVIFLGSCSTLKPLNFNSSKEVISVSTNPTPVKFIEEIIVTPQTAIDNTGAQSVDKPVAKSIDNKDAQSADKTGARPADKTEVKVVDKTETSSSEKAEVRSTDKTETPSGDKAEVKTTDKAKVKAVDKTEMPSGDKAEIKSTDKAELKTVDKTETPSGDKVEGNSIDKTDVKAVEKTETAAGDKTEVKSTDKTDLKAVDKTEMPPVDKAEVKTVDKAELKASEKTETPSGDKAGVKPTDKTEGKEVDKTETSSGDKAEIKSVDKIELKTADKKEVKASAKTETPSADKPEAKPVDKIEIKSADKTDGRSVETEVQSGPQPQATAVARELAIEENLNEEKKQLVAIMGSHSAPEVETASNIQLKYAVLLNTEVENLPAKTLLEAVDEWYGVRYRTGGCSKTGVDCSGFSGAVYAAAYGITLPRVSREQYRTSRKISTTELQEGDLVFFATRGNGNVSHVGVYLGNNKFIHASVSRGVMVSGLFEPYYLQRFVGAGRIDNKPMAKSTP